jgi:demethylmenaquinone methyltransferase/2-methoxy-6-polyprenyl-1,4-benzoquinol methylase
VGVEGKVYATDIHPVSVTEMRKKVEQIGLTNVVVQKEDAVHTSFADNSIDMIILYGVIPAPVIPLKELSLEMHRILKPGGVCAIWTAVPFWRPRGIEKSAGFVRLKRNYPIFRLEKR